jgi:hypothetical protein
MWCKDEGDRSLQRKLWNLWTKAFEGGETGAFEGVSKSICWAVVSILVCAVSFLLWYIALLTGSSSSSLSPVDPRRL